MIYLSLQTAQWILLAGASGCAFMIGRYYGQGDKNDTIQHTIDYLVDGGYVRYQKRDGEIELIPLDEKNS
tara:strand:+ start:1920 stop:2129 length:210 start_codon:yes stop_codon:yes gene_type:complete